MELPPTAASCAKLSMSNPLCSFLNRDTSLTAKEREMLIRFLSSGDINGDPYMLVDLLERFKFMSLKVHASEYQKEFLAIKLQEEWYRDNLYDPPSSSKVSAQTNINDQTFRLVRLTPELYKTFTLIPYLHYAYTRSVYDPIGIKNDDSVALLIEKWREVGRDNRPQPHFQYVLHSFNRPYVKVNLGKPQYYITHANDQFKERDDIFGKRLLRESVNVRRPNGRSNQIHDKLEHGECINPMYAPKYEDVMTGITDDPVIQILTKAGLWNRVCIAGGFILNHIIDCRIKSDYDLFVYASTEGDVNEKANETVLAIIEAFNGENENEVESISRSENAITIIRMNNKRGAFQEIQIILRLYKSKSEIIHGFDVDSCCVLFDGKDVWMTKRAEYSIRHMVNTVDFDRLSPSYEWRLAKYAKRGFSIYIPKFEESKRKASSAIPRKLWKSVGDGGGRLKGLDVLLYHYNHSLVKTMVDVKSDYIISKVKGIRPFEENGLVMLYSENDEIIGYKLHELHNSPKRQKIILIIDLSGDPERLRKGATYRIPLKVVWKTTNPGEQMTNTFHRLILQDISQWYEGIFYTI